MNGRRLTRQRWDAILSAMAYYETDIQESEMSDPSNPSIKDRRRHHESAMEWLLSVRPGREVTR